jgi:acetylglutamate kinase
VHGFESHTFLVRVDAVTLAAPRATFVDDLEFLIARGVRPIVVASQPELAREYVRAINRHGNVAVGLCGSDAALLPAASSDSLGAVQTRILTTLLDAGYVPVIEPTALNLAGEAIDVNADDVAAAIAAATEARRAIFFSEAGGVVDPASAQLISELTPAEALVLADRDDFEAALRQTVRAAAHGVRGGVGAAQIVDGRVAHAAIVEFLTACHLGTQVTGGVFVATA